jgi:YHS domain-containing protein
MKNIFLPVLLFLSCFTFPACHESDKSAGTGVPVTKTDSTSPTKPKFTAAMVDNKKDPSCGMPVTAGIEDTVHYNGKVYGFCSDECKQVFLRNPDVLAKSAEMK